MQIFIKKLHEKVTPLQLRKAAEQYGRVITVAIIKDVDTGKSTGFAYIEMSTKEEAKKALKGLRGSEFKGQKITVKESSSPILKKQASESLKNPLKTARGFQHSQKTMHQKYF